MKCKRGGYEEWAEESATYHRKTKKYEILLECPKCHGVMIWHNKKVEQWESGFDPEDLPFSSSIFIMPSKLKCSS